MTIPSVAKGTEKLYIYTFLVGNCISILENYFALSYKIKPVISIRTSHCTLGYLSHRNQNLCLHKTLCTNVNASFTHNSRKPETIWIFFNRLMVTLWYTQSLEYNSLIKRNKLAFHIYFIQVYLINC